MWPLLHYNVHGNTFSWYPLFSQSLLWARPSSWRYNWVRPIRTLCKNKESKADRGNYRGISLLSIAGKIFARIVLNRLIAVSEANLPEAQCGFRPGRSTVDMIFTVRQVQEKCLEQNLDLYSVFIDLTKAFDTVNREALCDVLARYCCPSKFIQIIRLFHNDMTG